MALLNKYVDKVKRLNKEHVSALEVFQSEVALESLFDSLDTLKELKVSAEQLEESLFTTENLSPVAAVFVNNFFQSINKQVGVESSVSLESLDEMELLQVSQEGIVDFIKKVWKVIADTVKKIFSMIKDFFKKIFSFVFGGRKKIKENNEIVKNADKDKKDTVKKSKDIDDFIKTANALITDPNKKLFELKESINKDDFIIEAGTASVVKRVSKHDIELKKITDGYYAVSKGDIEKIKDPTFKTQIPNLLALLGKKPGEHLEFFDSITMISDVSIHYMRYYSLVQKEGYELFTIAKDLVRSGYEDALAEKLENKWNSLIDELNLEQGKNFGNNFVVSKGILGTNAKAGVLRVKLIKDSVRVIDPSKAIVPVPPLSDLFEWSNGIETILKYSEKELKQMEKEYNVFNKVFEELDREIMKTSPRDGNNIDNSGDEREQLIKNRIDSVYELMGDLAELNNKVTRGGFGIYKELTQLGIEVSTIAAKLVE